MRDYSLDLKYHSGAQSMKMSKIKAISGFSGSKAASWILPEREQDYIEAGDFVLPVFTPVGKPNIS